MTPSLSLQDPAIEGPDYMALVIEWDDIDDLGEDLADDFGGPTMVREPARPIGLAVATMVGAIGIFALAAWGLHRLTA